MVPPPRSDVLRCRESLLRASRLRGGLRLLEVDLVEQEPEKEEEEEEEEREEESLCVLGCLSGSSW